MTFAASGDQPFQKESQETKIIRLVNTVKQRQQQQQTSIKHNCRGSNSKDNISCCVLTTIDDNNNNS